MAGREKEGGESARCQSSARGAARPASTRTARTRSGCGSRRPRRGRRPPRDDRGRPRTLAPGRARGATARRRARRGGGHVPGTSSFESSLRRTTPGLADRRRLYLEPSTLRRNQPGTRKRVGLYAPLTRSAAVLFFTVCHLHTILILKAPPGPGLAALAPGCPARASAPRLVEEGGLGESWSHEGWRTRQGRHSGKEKERGRREERASKPREGVWGRPAPQGKRADGENGEGKGRTAHSAVAPPTTRARAGRPPRATCELLFRDHFSAARRRASAGRRFRACRRRRCSAAPVHPARTWGCGSLAGRLGH